MKKTTKALYAAAAGLALITSAGGGRATYASWNDTAFFSAATISTGNLKLDFVPLAQQNNAPCGVSNSVYQQICWTMTPPAGSTVAAVSSYDFTKLPHVDSGFVLSGTTRVRGTLEGNTIVANFTKPGIDYGVYTDDIVTDANREKVLALEAWLEKSQTTVTVKNSSNQIVAQRDAQGNNAVTSPPTSSTTGDYTVTIEVRFSTTSLPDRTNVPISAYLRLGYVSLELLQQTTTGSFGG